VVAVVTQPDKPKGRGNKLAEPPVKEFALKNSIPVYQPINLRADNFNDILETANPDLIVVTAYGKILPKYVIQYPKQGCINVHASLLPKYRGAGPIQWCIINGEKETGVTTMLMDEGLDTGDMILKRSIKIGEDETAGELHDRLSMLGAQLLKETLGELVSDKITRIPQRHEEMTYAPILHKSIGEIDWAKTAHEIKNLVRGVNPWPVAYTYYKGNIMKVWSVDKADYVDTTNYSDKEVPGKIIKHVENEGLYVKSGGNTCVIVKEVQFIGGKRMTIDEYLRGHKMEFGEVLTKI
jgi:methionyl-tRNA formyltransferase